jgi:hypothetical protein
MECIKEIVTRHLITLKKMPASSLKNLCICILKMAGIISKIQTLETTLTLNIRGYNGMDIIRYDNNTGRGGPVVG